jgi:hypothetical protein
MRIGMTGMKDAIELATIAMSPHQAVHAARYVMAQLP